MDGQSDILGNVVKLVGEAVIPGASKMIDGEIASGVLHTAASALALVALGPIGRLVSLGVRLNSFSSSVNDRNLWELGREGVSSAPAGRAPAASGSTASTTGPSSRARDS